MRELTGQVSEIFCKKNPGFVSRSCRVQQSFSSQVLGHQLGRLVMLNVPSAVVKLFGVAALFCIAGIFGYFHIFPLYFLIALRKAY